MNATARKLLNEAMNLPENERADIAAELIESLDPHVDSEIALEWDAEIQRRLLELDSGTVIAVPWSEARKLIMGQPDVDASSCDSP